MWTVFGPLFPSQIRLGYCAVPVFNVEVEAESDRSVQARFAGTAWTQCDSWYRADGGRIVANWPGYMTEYADRVRTFDLSEFSFADQSVAAA